MIHLARVLDAVLREELPVLVSHQNILLIALFVAHGIRFLYASSRRCVVSGNGEPDHRVVVEWYRLLHESLAKRAAPDDGGAVVVLHGSREYFRCRCRCLVDEHYERYMLIRPTSVAAVFLSWRFPSLGIYDESSLGQEFICHLISRVEESSEVAPQVDDQVFHTLLRQFGQGYEQFGISILSEVLHLDISRIVVEHIRSRDTLLWNLTSCHGEVFHFLFPESHNTQFHLCVLRTFQSSHGLLVGHLLAHKRFAIHTHDFVSGDKPRPFRRTVSDNVLHSYSVLTNGEFYSHSRERALEVVVGSLHVLRTDIHRVWVEFGQYLRHGFLHQLVDIHRIHILVVDDMQQVIEFVATRVDDAQSVAREMVGVECSDDDTHHHAHSHYQRHIPVLSAFAHNNISILVLRVNYIHEIHLYSCLSQQVGTVCQSVFPCIHHTFYSRLDNQFCTFDAWRVGDVQRTALTVV